MDGSYYWFVYISALIIFLTIYMLYKTNNIDRFTWYLYWIGVALGLCWEIPLSIADDYSPYPPVTYLAPAPFPLPYSTILIMISASLWDGGLFLLGLLFVKIFCPAPHFEKFKGKELSVFVIYGQASELVVELISSSSHGWEFNIYPWNPLLFVFNGHNITLMPQLIWLVAPIIYYFIIIRLKKKVSDSKKILVN